MRRRVALQAKSPKESQLREGRCKALDHTTRLSRQVKEVVNEAVDKANVIGRERLEVGPGPLLELLLSSVENTLQDNTNGDSKHEEAKCVAKERVPTPNCLGKRASKQPLVPP